MAHLLHRLRFLPALALLAATPVGLSGCAGFFICQKASCPTGTTNSAASTGDYSYVANSSTSSQYVNGYSLSSGALTAATSSPYNFGFIPSAMVVTPNDEILFVGSSQTTAIYAYSIGTGGALSILNNGTAAAGEEVTSMAMSPDGNYLFALDASGSYLAQYSINYTTGALTQQSLTSFNLTGVTPEAVAVAPSGDFLAVSLGQAGFIVYPYTASTGAVAGTSGTPFTGSTTTSYYGLAIDSNNNLYVAETNGVVSVPVNSAGVPTVTSVTPKSAGTGPRGVAVSGSFVYVANSGDSTISLYTATSGGVLTALGNAISGPASVTTLSTDATGKYLLAAGYSSGSGLDLYSIATTGLITLDGSQPTTTNVAVSSAIASVH